MQNSQLPRRDFLIGLTAAAAAAATGRVARAQERSRAPTWMYVGSFTGEGRGHGEGLSVFQRAGESDRWRQIQLLKDLADPSFVITHECDLDDGPAMYKKFRDKEDGCIKVVLRP